MFPIPADIQAEYYRRIFEAAPEMLAALKAVAEEDAFSICNRGAQELAITVHKAIAKAEGKP